MRIFNTELLLKYIIFRECSNFWKPHFMCRLLLLHSVDTLRQLIVPWEMWQIKFNSQTQHKIQSSSVVALCYIVLRWRQQDLTKERSTLVQVGQPAITWTNIYPGLCRYMVSVGHNVLNRMIHRIIAKYLTEVTKCCRDLFIERPRTNGGKYHQYYES